jgi:hypothetical protein
MEELKIKIREVRGRSNELGRIKNSNMARETGSEDGMKLGPRRSSRCPPGHDPTA